MPVGARGRDGGRGDRRGLESAVAAHDPTAHAEIVALRAAAAARAQLPARIGDAVRDARAVRHVHRRGAQRAYRASGVRRLGSEGGRLRKRLFDLTREPRVTHRVDVFGGVCAEECRALLRRFFEARR